jgi:hypothetical protein
VFIRMLFGDVFFFLCLLNYEKRINPEEYPNKKFVLESEVENLHLNPSGDKREF